MPPQLNLATAFLAGLLSFASPCVLPLVPSYLSFLTGSSLEDLKAEHSVEGKARAIFHALAFISGFTLIFMLVGLSSSVIGSSFATHKIELARLGGAVIIVLGLNMMGLLRIPLLAMDKRFHFQPRKHSLWLSFVVGIGFAAGWSPCIGPILSAILLLAGQQELGRAALLLFAYSMGLAIPFLLTAAALTQSLHVLNRIKPALAVLETASGAVLTATGLLLVTDSLTRFIGFFYQYVKPPSL